MWDKVRKRIVDACDVMDMVRRQLWYWNCDSGDRNFSADWRTVVSQRGDGCVFRISGCGARRCHWCGIPENVM